MRRFIVIASIVAFAGCARQPRPQPLTPAAFVGGGNAAPTNGAPGERSQPAVAMAANDNLLANANVLGAEDRNRQPTNVSPQPRANTDVSPVVRDQVKAVGSGGDAVTRPVNGSSAVLGASSGQYLTLGGVVAEVNSTPIYASKVLALLDPALRQKAKQLDANNFRKQARELIGGQINELVRNELEYAAAQKALDDEDRRLAEAATIYWRMQQITQAGGSLELARKRSLQDPNYGMDFDERVQEQSRLELIRIYYQKKVYPKIQVTARDIREYYDKNLSTRYSDAEKVKFRIIKVAIKDHSNREQAINKITDFLNRAKGGADFAEMAMKENREKMFAGEKPFEADPKAFAIPKIREVLPAMQTGDVSEIIEDGQSYYIVKVEERKAGRVRSFDDQKVQDEIRTTLRTEQFRVLREREQEKLVRNAIVRSDEQMVSIALDMAMQKYAVYAAAK